MNFHPQAQLELMKQWLYPPRSLLSNGGRVHTWSKMQQRTLSKSSIMQLSPAEKLFWRGSMESAPEKSGAVTSSFTSLPLLPYGILSTEMCNACRNTLIG
ncbi:hypothetical protein JTE90_010216 [Oedothorax gibbosus]|uniref:Uncharacterized protein n=1 Tax=Oedothorax gibbosus TaxID=931172 RepID=A0AAV6UKF1_9ARAC|nr:hypothetical protein JTE90_010216 [Oedothorax gibbosus]